MHIINYIPIIIMPVRFAHFVAKDDPKKEKDINHLVQILLSLPDDLQIPNSKTLEAHAMLYAALPDEESNLSKIPIQMFLFACCATDYEHVISLKSSLRIKEHPSQQLKNLIVGIQQGIVKNPANASKIIDRILSTILYRELEDRFYILKFYTDVPFFIPLGMEVIIVAAAHFNLKFGDQFKEKIKNYVNPTTFDEVQKIVRRDVNLFCQALRRLPPRFDGSRRFEVEVWGENGFPHPEAGLWMLAFCSLYPTDVYRCMQWVVLPSERARLTQMSNHPTYWTVLISELLDLFILCR